MHRLPAEAGTDTPKTPLYDSLTTNLPHPIMAFQSLPFPPETPLYPRAAIVQEYLKQYALTNNLMPHVMLQTAVCAIDRSITNWTLSLSDGSQVVYDHLIIANGHFSLPRYPDVPGLPQWVAEGKVTHSAWYRRPVNFGKYVLVVGGGPSGRDISRDLISTGHKVYHSIPGSTPSDTDEIVIRSRVTKFLDASIVEFEDGSTVSGIDHAILATGYKMDFPFFNLMEPGLPSITPFPQRLTNSTYSIFPLARHIFPLQQDFPVHSVAFIGLPIRVAPFPIMECQMRAVVKVYRDPMALDISREASTIEGRFKFLSDQGMTPLNIARTWLVFQEMEQFDYRNGLLKFAGDLDRWQGESWV